MKPRVIVRSLISILLALALMVTAIYIFTNGRPHIIITVLSSLLPHYVLMAMIVRSTTPVLHGLSWYVIVRSYKGSVKAWDSVNVILASLLTEYLLPIGGATEAAKILLSLTKLKLDLSQSLVAVVAHRLVTSIALATMALVAIAWILPMEMHWSLYILLMLALGMIALNIALYGALKSHRIMGFVGRILSKFKIRLENFSYVKIPSPSTLLTAISISILERLSTIVTAILIALALRIELPLPLAILIFDSLRIAVLLLPIITPGCIGIVDSLQMTFLRLLGCTGYEYPALVLAFTTITLLTNIPLMCIATSRVIGTSISEWYRTLNKYLKMKVNQI